MNNIFDYKDIAHTHTHREMVKNEDIRAGFGDITFNMNSTWFMDLAESMGWSLMTEYFCDHPDLVAKCAPYDEYSFMKMTEDTITTFFNDSINYTTDDETTLDTTIWNYLEAHDDTWFSMFKNFFVYTEDADNIISFWEQFRTAKVGDIIVAENETWTTVNTEKTHSNKVGVKSPVARSELRQTFNDWFVDNFTILIADETITKAELEAHLRERDGEVGDDWGGTITDEHCWVDDLMNAMRDATKKGDKEFTVNLPPDVAKRLLAKSKKKEYAGEKGGMVSTSGNLKMTADVARECFVKVADALMKRAEEEQAGSK